VTATPFGRDVLPDVNWRKARSSGVDCDVERHAGAGRRDLVGREDPASVSTLARTGSTKGRVDAVVRMQLGSRGADDVRDRLVVGLDVLERELRVERHGYDPRHHRPEEREDELLQEVRPGRTFRTERLQEVRPGQTFRTERLQEVRPGQTFRTDAVQEVRPGQTFRTERLQEVRPGQTFRTDAVQEVRPGRTFRTELLQEVRPGRTFRTVRLQEV
jgi:sialic acid synthase SpsE